MTRGLFITFEGGEGAGKSTQIRRLGSWLAGQGRQVTLTREPGGSPGAEAIRSLLLDPAAGFDPVSQALLFAAARRDHMRATIRPALRRGSVVISDRFMDSTRAYQGGAGALSPAMIGRLERLAIGRTRPDLTLILDLDPAIGLARAQARAGDRAADRFEQQDLEFHRTVRAAFLAIAAGEPQRCTIIDANQPAEAVFAAIVAAVTPRLGAGPC